MAKRKTLLTAKDKEAYEMLQEVRKAKKTSLGPIKRNEHLKKVEAYLDEKAFGVDAEKKGSVKDYVEKLDRKSVDLSSDKGQEKLIMTSYKPFIEKMAIMRAPISEVMRDLYDISGVRFQATTVRYCIEAVKSDIKDFGKKVEEYDESLEDVPLYRRRYRLEKLQQLFKDAYSKFYSSKSPAAHDLMLKILAQAKREADEQEGNGANITINNNTIINNVISNEKIREIFGTLPINEIVLGKVCAKFGLNPHVMVDRLNRSVYAEFNGSNQTTYDSIEGEPDFAEPFLITSAEIQKRVDNRQKEDVELQRGADIKHGAVKVDTEKIQSIKDKVKHRLRMAKDLRNSNKE